MTLPTRVVLHGSGSVFMFATHRQPGMGDVEWKGDSADPTRNPRSSRSCLRLELPQ
jgi:hypothetical protein